MSHLPNSLNPEESRRPLAAFLMPGEGSFLYEQAAAFYGEHQELFVRPVALLGQEKVESGGSESLCLSVPEEGYYTWQLSRAESGYCDIWQARVGIGSTESRYYRLDRQGVVQEQSTTETTPASMPSEHGDLITAAYLRGYVQQDLTRVYQAKQRSIMALGDLVSRGVHKGRIERQEKIMNSVGFGTLKLYRPPSRVPSQGVVTEEGRRMFLESVERTQQLRATSVRE